MNLHSLLMLFFLWAIQPWAVVCASSVTPEEVLANINDQLRVEYASAKAELTIRGGRVLEIKKFDIRFAVKDGKEIIAGEIFEPAHKRGSVSITWESGRASIEHVEKRQGRRKRRLSVGLESAFLGSGFAYADIKILEDTENYAFNWVDKNVIEAVARREEVYGKKVYSVDRIGDAWVIKRLEYYDSKGRRLIKVRENLDFIKAYSGLRPCKVIVKKEKSKYITTLEMDWSSPTVFD